MGVESIRRKREVLTISCPGRGAAPHKRVHARLRRAMGRCTAGPGHKIAKTTPCKVEWAPALVLRCVPGTRRKMAAVMAPTQSHPALNPCRFLTFLLKRRPSALAPPCPGWDNPPAGHRS